MGISLEEGEKLLRGSGLKEPKPAKEKVEPKPVTVDPDILSGKKSTGVTVEEGEAILSGKKAVSGLSIEDGQNILEGKEVEESKPKPASDKPSDAFSAMEKRIESLDRRIQEFVKGA